MWKARVGWENICQPRQQLIPTKRCFLKFLLSQRQTLKDTSMKISEKTFELLWPE